MRKPIRTFIRRTALSTAIVGALSAAAVAQAGHGSAYASNTTSSDSYYAWVDVVSVQPRHVEHTVNETVERCYDVRTPVRVQTSTRDRRGRNHRYENRYDNRYDDRSVRSGSGNNMAATLIGGVLGGVIGNQLGGDGKNHGLITAGAVLGASIANSAANSSRNAQYTRQGATRYTTYEQVSRQCDLVSEPRRVSYVDGYDVTYRYHGQRFTKVMDNHPGNRMQVRIDVQPVI